ncbi:DUF3820 family protein [Vibrio pomeroyi]|uniref:DUF3820 family protein n=1 Tax=Vibrio pomeroyi TaxID=198832 RepID=A0ABV4MQQ0_9VIBR|nr:DUF3820 family protein [Vibrio atlanticus]MCZ4310967.1 DUF3820 family protein [Vibrio atlanticus]
MGSLFFMGVVFVVFFHLLANQGCKKLNENTAKAEALEDSKPLHIHGFLVQTHSDAERVHNLEKLTVRFGKHEGKTWSQVPTEYLTWMVHENHKYVQLARTVLAARNCNYTFV